MESNTGNPFSQCLCCIECRDDAKEFQKIMDLKNIGLVIYRHLVEIQDKNKDDATKVTEEIFILENTKDQEITSSQYLPEIEQNKISCPRCRKIFEHAQRLLHTIPNIDKKCVRGICDHCLMEQKSCYECEQIIQKFLSKAKELPENTKNVIKQWLSKVKHLFKNIDHDDNIKYFELEKYRTSSNLYVDRLLIKSLKQSREHHVKQSFLPKTTVAKGELNDQMISLEEGQETTGAQPKHPKEKSIRILEYIPPVPIPSKEVLSEGSLERPSTRLKSQYSNLKPDDMDLLFESVDKPKRERHSLRKYHSHESLLTIAEVISKPDPHVENDFSYFFPKKKKYEYPKRFASSTELIKETQDILQSKAEAERKKQEMKVLGKFKIQAKNKKGKAYSRAKYKGKEESSKDRREDTSPRHLTMPIEQKWAPTTMKEEQEFSSAKRDDESHNIYGEFGKTKIKGLAPSKTADFEEENIHRVKGERHAKGDSSKGVKPQVVKDSKVAHEGKTAIAKTVFQKDIKEDQKRKEKTEKEKPQKKYDEKVRQDKEQRQREKYDNEGQVRPAKEQKQREKDERAISGKGKTDERSTKELRQKDKEEKNLSGKGKINERSTKEHKQKQQEERVKSGKGKVDERTPKEQKQKERDKSEGKIDESPSKEQKQKVEKVKLLAQQKEVQQKIRNKKGEVNQIQPDTMQKEKKATTDKSTETPAKERNKKDEKDDSKKDKEQQLKQGKEKTAKREEELSELGQEKQQKEKIYENAAEQTAKQNDEKPRNREQKDIKAKITKGEHEEISEETGKIQRDARKGKEGKDKEEKEKNTKEKTAKGEEELSQETEKIQRNAREEKETISAKAQEALLELGQEKQQKDKNAAESTAKQKDEKSHRNREQKDIKAKITKGKHEGLSKETGKIQKDARKEKEGKEKEETTKEKTPKGEEELSQETEKIQRNAREGKEMLSAKAQEALLELGQEKQQKEKDTKQEGDKKYKEDGKSSSGKTTSGKTSSDKNKKSKIEKSPKKKMAEEEKSKKPLPEDDIAPKSQYARNSDQQPSEPETKDLAINTIRVRRGTPDDTILRLVQLKRLQFVDVDKRPKEMGELKALDKKLRRYHKPHKTQKNNCILCIESSLEFDLDSLLCEKKAPKYEEIIIGSKIYKYTPPFFDMTMEEEEPSAIPLLFKSEYVQEDKIDELIKPSPPLPPPPLEEKAPTAENAVKSPQKPETQHKKMEKQARASVSADSEATKGVVRYALSDRSFIEKGWTMLPTEKIVRKMNVYRMRPAQPEFDWFEHNKNKGQLTYDTGEILAEFDDNGRGRWFYRNGRLALDYYDAEELNANQRFVVWSSGEPDEQGRTQPYTILATFDYLGNGIVFDHGGKIRLKYNQTEGIVLDRKIGPVSHWKWHTLNDPPVLQQVMIDTQMPYKDQTILKLGGDDDKISRPDNEEMLTIEFENFIKEKSKKLTQSFKPFQIKMKALKINEHFSLRVMDQASVYLIYRDGTTNLKLNIGMILDHKEIVDTDTADLGEVSVSNIERLPATTDSLAALQMRVAYAQGIERVRSARERRLRLPQTVNSADRMTAAASRPLRPPLRSIPSDTSSTRTGHSCSRKPTTCNIYYDNRLF